MKFNRLNYIRNIINDVIILYIILLAALYNIYSEPIGIDTVYFFQPGSGQNIGQDSSYFPHNIFGMPDSSASIEIPASDPSQILSLGLGGEIVVGMKDYYIDDKPGPDFIIFENAFLNPVTSKVFAEPAKIAVSSDGENFYEFPFVPLTLQGCAGITPTNGSVVYSDIYQAGGDAFDLADLGITKASRIKITDISEMILNNPEHPYYDPIISGFDLDAVVILNYSESSVSSVGNESDNEEQFEIRHISSCLFIENRGKQSTSSLCEIYDLTGQCIFKEKFSDYIIINSGSLPVGVYFVATMSGNSRRVEKVIVE